MADGLIHHGDAPLQRFFDKIEAFERIDVDLAQRALAPVVRGAQDLFGLLTRLVKNPLLGDEIGHALFGDFQDLIRRFVRLGDDALALANDPAGLLDLVWHRDTELVD